MYEEIENFSRDTQKKTTVKSLKLTNTNSFYIFFRILYYPYDTIRLPLYQYAPLTFQ